MADQPQATEERDPMTVEEAYEIRGFWDETYDPSDYATD
jgi:hypothetical protein